MVDAVPAPRTRTGVGVSTIRGADNLASGFFRSAERWADRPALVVGDQRLTYRQLAARASTVASTIDRYALDAQPLAAILASRSVTAYAGILGILGSGRGYVPLNPSFPVERTRKMLRASGASLLVVDGASLAALPKLLRDIDRAVTVIAPDIKDWSGLPAALPWHRFVGAGQLSDGIHFIYSPYGEREAVAYLLFTSGTTGEPKGVPISNGNVRSYLHYVGGRYDLTEQDRCSQEFELTFDLSVHDMFVCWERGACLFCVPRKSVMLPVAFIREHALTTWFSVPSVAGVLARLDMLQPSTLPSLRYSLFCGEPLLAAHARLWQQAAPNSILENLYGPTEATIAISRYRWDSSMRECVNGIVPIGRVFDGQQSCVLDEQGEVVQSGEAGELCLAGSQVTRGYWNDPDKTREKFIELPGRPGTVWYRTGDVARCGADGCLHYLGRIDQQVKIRGYRVELQEIEAVLRRICRTEHVIAVPDVGSGGTAEGIIAYVSGVTALDHVAVLSACREVLADYMVPRQLRVVAEMPLNANGKIDRARLLKGRVPA
jgi:amino acid adenylation domain-containing protein